MNCKFRSVYMRDRDRIVHSKSFRRLMHKTQVFICPEGDHYRTRLTHTLEVSGIARTMARALDLNEDLTEACSLGHDLGHTPFGHAGETVLNQLHPGGFRHNLQSLRVVERLEKSGRGLDLSRETKDGILCHTGERRPATLEGALTRIADRIAYINHDIDDAVRAGILKQSDIPANISAVLGENHSDRINTMVTAVITSSKDSGHIIMEKHIAEATDELRAFMFERVYSDNIAKAEEQKARGLLESLYIYYIKNYNELPAEYLAVMEAEGTPRAVCDYIAGMSDRYAVNLYEGLFIPKTWQIY